MAPHDAAPPSYGEATRMHQESIMEKHQRAHQLALKQPPQAPASNEAGPSRSPAISTAPRPRIRCADGHTFAPVVIPQTTAKLTNAFMSPFARAYAPDLAAAGVSEAQFIRCIDELNEVFMLNPAFQVLGFAGQITAFVPEVITMAVGTGVQVLSGAAGAAMSYARTRAFVKRVNEELFVPRGMRLRILSTDKMMEAIGEPAKGAVDRQGFVMQPLPTHDEAWDPRSSATDPRMRRVEALEGRVAALSWNVPPLTNPEGILGKMGAWQAEKQERKERKKHSKMCRKANKAQRRLGGGVAPTPSHDDDASSISSDSSSSSSDSSDAGVSDRLQRRIDSIKLEAQYKADSKPRKADKIMLKCNEDVAKLTSDIDKAERKAARREAKSARKMAKHGDKYVRKSEKAKGKIEKRERKVNQRVRWIVIVPDDGASPATPTDEEIDLGLDDQPVNEKSLPMKN